MPSVLAAHAIAASGAIDTSGWPHAAQRDIFSCWMNCLAMIRNAERLARIAAEGARPAAPAALASARAGLLARLAHAMIEQPVDDERRHHEFDISFNCWLQGTRGLIDSLLRLLWSMHLVERPFAWLYGLANEPDDAATAGSARGAARGSAGRPGPSCSAATIAELRGLLLAARHDWFERVAGMWRAAEPVRRSVFLARPVEVTHWLDRMSAAWFGGRRPSWFRLRRVSTSPDGGAHDPDDEELRGFVAHATEAIREFAHAWVETVRLSRGDIPATFSLRDPLAGEFSTPASES